MDKLKKMHIETVDLLSCPFCGQARGIRTVYFLTTDEASYYVICPGCGAQGPTGDTPEEAIASWNSRVTP